MNNNLIIPKYEILPDSMDCPCVPFYQCEGHMKQIHKTDNQAIYQCTNRHCRYTKQYNYDEESKFWWREGYLPESPSKADMIINDMGAAGTMILCYIILGIIFIKFMWYVLPLLFVAGIILLIIFKGEEIMEFIKEMLGLKKINMKLSALARYMKVKFIHVPEHYKCKEDNISKPPNEAPKP